MKTNKIIKKMSLAAMFIALSYAITLLFNSLGIVLVPSTPWLKYDPKDILICICGLILGPYIAFGVSAGVSLIEMVTFSSTGFYGFIMNVLSTCSLVIPCSFIYQYKRNFKGAIISLFIGYISNLVMMTLWNIVITPIWLDQPRKVVVENFLSLLVLFNIIKTGINIGFILLLYKPIITSLRFTHLIIENNSGFNLKNSLIMIAIGITMLAGFTLCIILLKK